MQWVMWEPGQARSTQASSAARLGPVSRLFVFKKSEKTRDNNSAFSLLDEGSRQEFHIETG